MAPAQAADRAGPGGRPYDGTVVATDSGRVRGSSQDGYRSFQGIPYAAPPVGDLRWRDPQPVTAWSGVRPVSTPGSPCLQSTGTGLLGSEDCLYLNVTTPARAAHRPVVVWLHGGGFSTGAGSDYDPHRMAVAGDVVVVTVNYRLGVLGGFGYPGLAGSGDFGLADQQAALRWVRRNAAAFGGDPGNVTLAGQSAGGMSVCSQLTSPSAAGLFDKALIQSGSCLINYPDDLFFPGMSAGSPWTTRTAVEAAGSAFAGTVGCAGLDCLRQKPAADLLRADLAGPAHGGFAKPAYGTALLPEEPAAALRAGRFHRVPVLEGGNRDEHRGWAAALNAGWTITADRYRQLLTAAFGDRAAAVAAQYPVSAYPSPAVAWATVATDRIWSCPTLTGEQLMARHTRLYAYEFADRSAPLQPGSVPGFPYGAYHAAELPYLFDLTGWPITLTPEQQGLSREMIAAWSAFATTGRPWPRLRDPADTRLFAPGEPGTVDLGTEHDCGFWSGF
ncbi:carboxylesterase/lipase family protein [Kitasatospora viridis]|uniref:carboxylesterase/lipase family protein n=1 Tax=Kitasatospora viridis TaxID=281105 RepID=UPI001BA62A4D|nr:carboxylesterase family protein [Kitasatospora viridis]